jgi:hypothetical protein
MFNRGVSTLEADRAESFGRNVDDMTKERTGMSIFHILALLSIVGSLVLFFSGRKTEAIFVGLWPPTIEAIKSATEKKMF